MNGYFSRKSALLLASILGTALLLLTLWLGHGGLPLLLAVIAWMAAGERACRFLAGSPFPPYPFMALSPLLLLHYSSVTDFRIRLACLVMLLYTTAFACRQPGQQGDRKAVRLTPFRAWLLSLLAFSLASTALYVKGVHLSGDEPHYVMIAQSLVADGDFDLKNNMEDKTYFAFLPVEIRFHGSIQGGKFHSFHLPGLSFILLPFYALFRMLGGILPGALFFRLAAAVLNSLFGLGLFLAMRSFLRQEGNDRLFIFFLLTFPLAFHAAHLYPELPAATLMLFAVLLVRDRKRYLLSGLLLAGLPWLHLKYSIPALVLALVVIVRLWRDNPSWPARLRRALTFVAPAAVSLALLSLYSKVLYGSFHPGAISPEKNFFAIPLRFRIETLLSFFLDQRDGLMVFAPLFLLVFLAGRRDVRSQIRDFPLLAGLFASYVLFHAFTTVRGAYSPAARPTLFVLWVMAVFLAAIYRRAGPGLQSLFRMLAGLTAFASAWIVYYPLFLYQPVTREVVQRSSSWLSFMGSEVIDLPSFFPSFLKSAGNTGWLPNVIWLGLLLAALAAFYFSRLPAPRRSLVAAAGLPLLGLALVILFCAFPHVRLQTRYRTAGLSFYCNSRNLSYHSEPGAYRVQAGADYDLFVDLKGSAASRLNLTLFSGKQVDLILRNGSQKLLACSRFANASLRKPLAEMKKFRLGKRELVHLGLETTALEKNAAFYLKLD